MIVEKNLSFSMFFRLPVTHLVA